MRGIRVCVGNWLEEQFPILPNHPGETEAFRRRFQKAAALLLAFRAVGMVPATVTFIAAGDGVAVDQAPVVVLAALYTAMTLVAFVFTADFRLHLNHTVFHRGTPLRFGLNRAGWLDRRRVFELDLALAVVLNLLVAALVNTGAAYDQPAEVMAVANITTVMLWTGRRGGWIGLRVVAIIALSEVLKGPVNGVGLTGVDIASILVRLLWTLSGWLVAVGVVRILLDYAERVERRRIEDDELWAVARSHDVYRNALAMVSSLLRGVDGEHAAQARILAAEAATGTKEMGPKDQTIGAIAEYAASRGRGANPAMNFVVVDATDGSVAITKPRHLATALENLCINAARHSDARRTTVRCDWSPDGGAEVSVRDVGIGMPDELPTGGGIGIVRRAVEALDGDAYRADVPSGTMWVVKIPASVLEKVDSS